MSETWGDICLARHGIGPSWSTDEVGGTMPTCSTENIYEVLLPTLAMCSVSIRVCLLSQHVT